MNRTSRMIAVMLAVGLVGCSSGSSPECQQDSDCQSGTYCGNQRCKYDCRNDGECPDGAYCDSRGRCIPGCTKTNGGVETCDGLDNDCDDETDEELLNRCGECSPPDDQLFELCGDGLDNDCDGSTDEGFEDLGQPCSNQECPGVRVCSADLLSVECNAPDPAEDDTTCDGADDDCDGETDEDAQPLPCPLQEGVCAGAQDVCLGDGTSTGCDYGPAYTPDVDDACDQQDNDCDGLTDEDAGFLLVPELDEQAGDGLDNNCNGLVDEPGGVMVPVTNYPNVWIDSYEVTVFASADCQGLRYGEGVDDYPAEWPEEGTPGVTLYACSLPDTVPSAYLSWFQAKWACEAQGKVLCPREWWGDGCTGGTFQWYPYGTDRVNGVCNDPIAGPGQATPTGSYEDCTAGTGTFDMSGNLAEWIENWSTDHPGTALTGGFHFYSEFCDAGHDCQPIDPASSFDLDMLEHSMNCLLGEGIREVFPPNQGRVYLGTRCCLEKP